MPVVRSSTEGGNAGRQPGAPEQGGAARGHLRHLGRSLIGVCFATVAVGLAGFAWFLWSLPADEVVLARNADGIVVLTGGASRIADAMELLATGHGRRLLISGVNPATTFGEISRLNPEYGPIVSCCVDFDRSLNTLGNAIETKHWVESRGFRSLIVVTSNYHMPRAMVEIAHQLPNVSLLPFPVVADKLHTEPWWTHGPMMRLVLSEYLKYVAAQLRIRLDPGAGAGSARVNASGEQFAGRKSEISVD